MTEQLSESNPIWLQNVIAQYESGCEAGMLVYLSDFDHYNMSGGDETLLNEAGLELVHQEDGRYLIREIFEVSPPEIRREAPDG